MPYTAKYDAIKGTNLEPWEDIWDVKARETEEQENYEGDMDAMNIRDFVYGELKDFADKWNHALTRALKRNDMDSLAKFLTDDCEMYFCVPGHWPDLFHRPLYAKGKENVMRVIKEQNILGYPGWDNPWFRLAIDPRKAVLFYMYDIISPYKKKDGSFWQCGNYCTTQLHYAGAMKIKKIVDVTDREYMVNLKRELVAAHVAPLEMVQEVNEYVAQYEEDEKAWQAFLGEVRANKDNPDAIAKIEENYYINELRAAK
jgi:hypothetical protein